MNLIEAEILAKELIEKYCPEYTFKWARGKGLFGYCNTRKKEISLSALLVGLNSLEQVTDVILHEIAHALCPKDHHNRNWQKTALSIGCNGRRTYGDEVITPKPKWIGTCPKCGRTILRNNRKNISCGKCSTLYSEDLRFTFVKNL